VKPFIPHTITAALVLLAAGCAGGPGVNTTVDADGYTVVRTVDNEIGLEGEREFSEYALEGIEMDLAGVERAVFLDAVRRSRPGERPIYFLRLTYTGPVELYIERRRSLELAVDNSGRFTLRGTGTADRSYDEMNRTHTETFDYTIPMDVLYRLSRARDVTLQITGRDIVLNGYLLDRNFDAFRRFVDDHVDAIE
jgi:hypothetical protein